jgi:hypothetical protein
MRLTAAPGKLDRCPYEIQRGVCESGIFVRMRRCMKMKELVESEERSQTVAREMFRARSLLRRITLLATPSHNAM